MHMARLPFSRRFKKSKGEIAPEDIFIDSSNLPQFNTYQFEGRLERPVERSAVFAVGIFFLLLTLLFTGRLFFLQVDKGEAYALLSERNRLRHSLIFATRGVIYDRNGVLLAWNEPNLSPTDFSLRKYISSPGFSHILGYVKYPSRDSDGFFYRSVFVGEDGVEAFYNTLLAGRNGLKIIEIDALGLIQSESIIDPPIEGRNLTLSLDSRIQEELYRLIEKTAKDIPFGGGGGVIMDVKTGEIIALASVPEYDSNSLTQGIPEEVDRFVTDPQKPFLNRVTAGLYAPGSIIKPFVAIGALQEGVITPEKKILSTGSISIENPYAPGEYSVFRDWKAHGWVDMRQAIAVSSDVYFYEVGGGFEDQKGLGIENLEKYMRLFGLSEPVGIDLPYEETGVIPNPSWKSKLFDDEWRVGDTYNTAIGQYGMQVTPLQVVRAVAALANGGYLLRPHIVEGENTDYGLLHFNPENFLVVKEGMRRGVTEGTASGLSNPYVAIAAKTGTAELGALKQFVNSWAIGFFPYENPRYAFAIILERGPAGNLVGGVSVMRQLFEFMAQNTPEYFKDN